VLAFAPRIPPRLVQALSKLDDRSVPIAETYRRLGEKADRMGITRPSYQRIRELVHQLRRIHRDSRVVGFAWRLAVRRRPFEVFLGHASGIAVRRLE
jgi:hypothetical protein